MKYFITFAILILFAAGVKAQDAVRSIDDENGGYVVSAESAFGAGLNTTFMKKHQGDFKISPLVMMKENPRLITCSVKDDDTCGEGNGSCRNDAFIWGAISVLAGLIAFTGIKK